MKRIPTLSGFSTHSFATPSLAFYFTFFWLLGTIGFSAITISGVANKQIYADTVTFTIQAESGYNYAAALNGLPVAVGSPVVVDVPQYYELAVSRVATASGTEENTLIQFIVRASERASTELGLPLWTPYPTIDSAAAEFSGAELTIITPAAYPQGLAIPVIARVQDAAGKRVGVNGRVEAEGFAAYPLQLLRGVGSVFLPAAAGPGPVSYPAEVHSLSSPKQIDIEASTTWQTVSGTIAASTNWGQNARILVSGNITVPAGVTVTIGAGSVLALSPNVVITVTGSIAVNGTNEQPVVFTTQDTGTYWGGFAFESATSQGDFTGTIFTASGADSNWFNTHSGYFTHRKEQCLFLLSNGSHVNLTDCYMVENHGQIGHGEKSYLTMTGCLMQKCTTVGQYNEGSVTFEDCAMIEFPPVRDTFIDADNDAIYLSGGPHSFTDCLFGWTLDDGIDAGQGVAGAVTVDGCWFESCIHEAMAWSSGPRYATVIDTVVLNCGQAIECGYDYPYIEADHCFATGNLVGARFGDNYARAFNGTLDVQNSLLLYNWRDVWGRAWDNWQLHLSQMNIQNNYLSVPNENHPNNTLWDPQNTPAHADTLAFFLPTPAQTVGIGIATLKANYDMAELKEDNEFPVRLSTFTTHPVTVNYTVYANTGILTNGTLSFPPGQTVQHINFSAPLSEELQQVRIVLSDPVNAELTNYAQIIFEKPYEIAETLVAVGDTWKYFKGTAEPPAAWNELTFNDEAWLSGPSGFGYEASSGYQACIATNLTDMRGSYYSVYARKLFWVEDPARMTELELTMEWDDGYILYINGVPVNSQNPPDPIAYNQPAASDSHEACCGSTCAPYRADLSSFIGLLNPGFNVLAIQVHNGTLSSSDFIFIPTLSSVTTPIAGDLEPDGDVDLTDFAGFAMAWLSAEGQGAYNPVCDLDHSGDGSINLLDLSIFIENWMAGL